MGTLANELQGNIENKDYIDNVGNYLQKVKDGVKDKIYDFDDWKALNTVIDGALSSSEKYKLSTSDLSALPDGLKITEAKMLMAAQADYQDALKTFEPNKFTHDPELRETQKQMFIDEFSRTQNRAHQAEFSTAETAKALEAVAMGASSYLARIPEGYQMDHQGHTNNQER